MVSEGYHQNWKGARIPMVLAFLQLDVKNIKSYDNFLKAQMKSNGL